METKKFHRFVAVKRKAGMLRRFDAPLQGWTLFPDETGPVGTAKNNTRRNKADCYYRKIKQMAIAASRSNKSLVFQRIYHC